MQLLQTDVRSRIFKTCHLYYVFTKSIVLVDTGKCQYSQLIFHQLPVSISVLLSVGFFQVGTPSAVKELTEASILQTRKF